MSREVAGLGESPPADWTLIGTMSGVNSHVSDERGAVSERSST